MTWALLLLLTWTYQFGNWDNDPRVWVIERKEGTGQYAVLAYRDAGINEYHDTTAITGQTYSYRVAGINEGQQGPYSNEATGTEPPITIPNAPSNTVVQIIIKPPMVTLPQDLAATIISSTSIRLDWSQITNPSAWYVTVRVSVNAGPYTLILDSKTLTNYSTYTHVNLGPGTYQYQLRVWDTANKLMGESNQSNMVTI